MYSGVSVLDKNYQPIDTQRSEYVDELDELVSEIVSYYEKGLISDRTRDDLLKLVVHKEIRKDIRGIMKNIFTRSHTESRTWYLNFKSNIKKYV